MSSLKESDGDPKPKIKFRFNYDEKENEFVEVEKDTIREMGIIIGINILISIGLALVFRVYYLNYLGSLSLYLFTLSGALLLIGSVTSLCQESPSLQYLVKGRNKDKVRIRTTSDLKIYLLSAITLFLLSFVVNYINKNIITI